MDTITLVNHYIEEGERLLRKLPSKGFEVVAAFWLLPSEKGEWRSYVVSPQMEREGPRKAYEQLHAVLRQLQPQWIDVLEIKLLAPSNPVIRQVLDIVVNAPGPNLRAIRWGGSRLGNVEIEGALLYPLPENLPPDSDEDAD